MIALRPSRRRPPSSVRLSFLSLVIVLVTLLWPATHALAQSTEADVYVAQAVLEYSEGKYDEALANLRKALETEPDHVEALYLTGVVLMAKDQPAQATPFLEKARARSRTDPPPATLERHWRSPVGWGRGEARPTPSASPVTSRRQA